MNSPLGVQDADWYRQGVEDEQIPFTILLTDAPRRLVLPNPRSSSSGNSRLQHSGNFEAEWAREFQGNDLGGTAESQVSGTAFSLPKYPFLRER